MRRILTSLLFPAALAAGGCSGDAVGTGPGTDPLLITIEAAPEIFAAGEDVRVTVFAKNRSGSVVQFGIGSSSCQLAGAVRVAGEDAPMIIHRACLADMAPWRLDPGEERTETWTWKGMVRLDGAAQTLPPGEYEVTGVAGDYRGGSFVLTVTE